MAKDYHKYFICKHTHTHTHTHTLKDSAVKQGMPVNKNKKRKRYTSNLTMASVNSVQLLSHVRLFATPQSAARQATLSIISSQSLLRLMSIRSVMPSNHLILCHLGLGQIMDEIYLSKIFQYYKPTSLQLKIFFPLKSSIMKMYCLKKLLGSKIA